jgi:(2Fe-2S) ferredoxin
MFNILKEIKGVQTKSMNTYPSKIWYTFVKKTKTNTIARIKNMII